jgi:hypothetical protein
MNFAYLHVAAAVAKPKVASLTACATKLPIFTRAWRGLRDGTRPCARPSRSL